MNKGYVYIISTVSLWAVSSGILVKLISLPPLPFYALGSAFGALFILFILFLQRDIKSLLSYTKTQYILITLVGILVAVNNGLFFFALKHGLIANAVLSHSLYAVLIVILFAPLLLKEKITMRILGLVLLSFAGLFILTLPSFQTALDTALIAGFASAIFLALSATLEKKVAVTTTNPLVPVLYKNICALLLFAPFSTVLVTQGISLQNLALTAVWGILVVGLSFVLYFKSLQLIPVSHLSVMVYGEPIGAIILAFFFFHQPINSFVIVGGGLIIISGILLIFSDTNK